MLALAVSSTVRAQVDSLPAASPTSSPAPAPVSEAEKSDLAAVPAAAGNLAEPVQETSVPSAPLAEKAPATVADLPDSVPAAPVGEAVPVAPAARRIPILAVQPLSGKGVSAEEAELIGDALAAELQKTDSVRTMERSQMDKILAEQGFQNSGACSGSECVVQMGQMLGIDQMVVGTVGKLGGSFILNVRLVGVATGEVIRSSSRNLEAPIDAVVNVLAPVVAADLVGAKPDLANLEAAQKEAREAKARAAALPPVAVAPKSESHAGLWWTAGGVVVAGGAAAAYFLLQDDAKAVPAASATPETDVWVTW